MPRAAARRPLLAALIAVAVLVTAVSAAAVSSSSRLTDGRPTSVSNEPDVRPFCPGRQAPHVVSCLVHTLDTVWSAALHRPVHIVVSLRPPRSAVPRSCRAGLRIGTAFVCPADRHVYVTGTHLHRLRELTRASGVPLAYGLAATLSHESGHFVQFAADDRLLLGRRSPAKSRRLEQQADCLSGYWAARVPVVPRLFEGTVRRVLVAIRDPWETRTHGTVARRLAALDRGLGAPHPARCGVVVAIGP